MLVGGVGWMAGPACLIPAQSVKLYELASAQEWEAAMVLQRQLWGMNQLFCQIFAGSLHQRWAQAAGISGGRPIAPAGQP